MTVGNISSYADVNTILAAGRADLCVLARAHLCDPYWTRHAACEQGVELPWPDQYTTVRSFTPAATNLAVLSGPPRLLRKVQMLGGEGSPDWTWPGHVAGRAD